MGWRRTIGTHAKLLFVHLSIRPTRTERRWYGCDGECRPPGAARGIPANAQATGSDNLLSAVLGRFIPRLARRVKSAVVRETGYGDSVATRTVSQILGPVVPAAAP